MSKRTWVGKQCDCGKPAEAFDSGKRPVCNTCKEIVNRYFKSVQHERRAVAQYKYSYRPTPIEPYNVML